MRAASLAVLVCMAAVCSAAEPQHPEPKREAQVNLTPGAQARPGLYEEILAAVVRLNKSIALSRVEPLNCTCRHAIFPIDSKTRNDGDRNPRARQGEPSHEKAPLS